MDGLAIVLIMAFGLALRLVGLDSPLWNDEIATLDLARLPILDMLGAPRDETPFLYYALHGLLLPGSTDPATVRLLSLTVGMLAIPTIYFGARIALDRSVALAAAMLVAAWPLHVQYSQEARAHVLLFLLVAMSLFSLAAWFDRRHTQRPAKARMLALAIFILSTIAAFYTHLLALFWMLLVVPVFLLGLVTAGTARGEGFFGLMVLAAASLPGMHWLFLRMDSGHSYYWLDQATPLQAASQFVGTLLPPLQVAVRESMLNPDDAGPLLLGGGFLLSAILVAAAFQAAPTIVARFRSNPAAMTLVLALAMMPLLLWIAGFLFLPLLSFRNLAWAAPGPILLWAMVVAGQKNDFRRLGVAAVLILSLLLVIDRQGVVPPRSGDRPPVSPFRPGDANSSLPLSSTRLAP